MRMCALIQATDGTPIVRTTAKIPSITRSRQFHLLQSQRNALYKL